MKTDFVLDMFDDMGAQDQQRLSAALDAALNDVREKHNLTPEGAVLYLITDWLVSRGYLQADDPRN